MKRILKKENLRVRVPASDWRGAVRAAGDVLYRAGSVSEDYVQTMIRAIEEYGPYMVIGPGLALVHGAPGHGVIQTDMALLTLKEPVFFGSINDPVALVLAFGAENSQSHLQGLARAARALEDRELRERLIRAETVEELDALLHGQ